MVAIIYWPILLVSFIFAFIGVFACLGFAIEGRALEAIFSLLLIFPAAILLIKKKSIYNWRNKKGNGHEIIGNDIAQKDVQHIEPNLEQLDAKSATNKETVAIKKMVDSNQDYSTQSKQKNSKAKNQAKVITIESSPIRYFNLIFSIMFFIILMIRNFLFDTSKNKSKKTNYSKRPPAIQLITPWILELDTSNNIIRFKKRNWYLIGTDTQTYKYVNVRNILIDEKIITADIHIKVYSGAISAYYFSKDQAKYFKACLLRDTDFDERLFEEQDN
jgi:hypothetical protein